MANYTQEEIDATFLNFIEQTVIYSDLLLQEQARLDLLNDPVQKAIFTELMINDPDFYARWSLN
jgi:hypothetical protein